MYCTIIINSTQYFNCIVIVIILLSVKLLLARIAIANCEQLYIRFCIFSIFLNRLELET